jgi:acetyl esterase/lipase
MGRIAMRGMRNAKNTVREASAKETLGTMARRMQHLSIPISAGLAACLCLLAVAPLLAQQPAMPPVPDDVIARLDVEYSRVGERMAMDVFRPKAAGPHPGVIAIHGGGFRRGSRTSYVPLCIRLAQRGFVCATVSYRLSPRHQFPAPVEDVKAAVRHLRANAALHDLDPNRIGATGGSAGGHLALMLGLTGAQRLFEGSGPNLEQSSQVQAVVNYYGPTDFTHSYGKSVDAAEVLPLFLGGDLAHHRRYHLAASPLYYVNPLAAPTLTIHGTQDNYVAYEQGVWITDRLVSAGVEAELETIAGAGHGFKGPDAERAESRLIGFFERHLRPKPQVTVLVADHGPRGEVVAIDWPSGVERWRVPNGRGHDVQALPGALYGPARGQPEGRGSRNRRAPPARVVVLGRPRTPTRRAAPAERQHADRRRPRRPRHRGRPRVQDRMEVREPRPRPHAHAQRTPDRPGHDAHRGRGRGQADRGRLAG